MSSAETAAFQHRQARIEDADIVLALMRDFYVEEHLVFDETATTRAVSELLSAAPSPARAPALGVIFLFESVGRVVGHATVTFGFSLEFHGCFALLDELYLIPAARGHGWGRMALEIVAAYARAEGIATLRLEVNRANAHARSVYLKAGFNDDQRDLLTHWLR